MRTESQIDIHFRNLLRGDFDRVMQIERSCFFTPWNRATMIHKLAGRRTIARVATLGRDDPIAYLIYNLLITEVEIENMAVDPHYQRLGIGRRMIDRLIAKKRPKIVAAVWERNVEAQLFFRAMGFRVVEQLYEYWKDGPKDEYAYLMTKDLSAP